jgi:hypothetical protein
MSTQNNSETAKKVNEKTNVEILKEKENEAQEILRKIQKGEIDFSVFQKTMDKVKISQSKSDKKSIYRINVDMFKFVNDKFHTNLRIEQKESQIRGKLRDLLISRFVVPILSNDYSKEEKQHIYTVFCLYYKKVYINNDCSINSLVNSTFDKISLVEQFLTSFKNWLTESKIDLNKI